MIKLIIYGVIAAAVMGAIYGAWRAVDHWCNSSCIEQKELVVEALAEIADLKAKIAAAIAMRDDMVMRWSTAIQNVERVYVEVEKIRIVRFETIRERVGKIELAACPIPNDAALLLRDITAAANTPTATATPGPSAEPEAPVPAPAGWLSFAASAGEAYRERDDARLECIAQYNAVRDSIIKTLGIPQP